MDSYEKVLDFFEKADAPARTGDIVEATGLDKKKWKRP